MYLEHERKHNVVGEFQGEMLYNTISSGYYLRASACMLQLYKNFIVAHQHIPICTTLLLTIMYIVHTKR